MTLEGTVQDGIVVLAKGASIPNGTHVQVVVPEAKEQPAASANSDLSSDSFIGIWKDRLDLTDSSAWVRNIRQDEWQGAMANPTLIDTDILIDVGRGSADALSCLANLQSISALATSAVTEMELIVGCRNNAELLAVEGFLKQFQVVKIDETITDKAVELLKTYRLRHGLLIADAFIAATAIVLAWPFITKNRRDFRFVVGLNLLPYP